MSPADLMFISHVHNWGPDQALRLAEAFDYNLSQPIPVLLQAGSELKNHIVADVAPQ
jgi:hypothetical protein